MIGIAIEARDDGAPGKAMLTGEFVPEFVSCDRCGRPPGVLVIPNELMLCSGCKRPLTWDAVPNNAERAEAT